MSELLIELFSEEIPSSLQVNARSQIEKLLSQKLKSSNLNYKNLSVYSTPTRLTVLVSSLPILIKIPGGEIKGPKVGVPENVIENFARSKEINVSDLYQKQLDKGNFYFAKIKSKEIKTEDELSKLIPKLLNEISWKKSMRWSNYNLSWGRPLRSILAIFNKKPLKINFEHLNTVNFTLIEENGELKQKKVQSFLEYQAFLRKNIKLF